MIVLWILLRPKQLFSYANQTNALFYKWWRCSVGRFLGHADWTHSGHHPDDPGLCVPVPPVWRGGRAPGGGGGYPLHLFLRLTAGTVLGGVPRGEPLHGGSLQIGGKRRGTCAFPRLYHPEHFIVNTRAWLALLVLQLRGLTVWTTDKIEPPPKELDSLPESNRDPSGYISNL